MGLQSAGLVVTVSDINSMTSIYQVPITFGTTTFASPSAMRTGVNYAVTIKTQPVNDTCRVTNGTGTVGNSNVSNAIVTCTATPIAGIVFEVNSTADDIDDNVGDGICHTAANTCTLRAAVMQANRVSGPGSTIRLPAGVFNLARPATPTNGDDAGDLNLTTPTSGSPVINIVGAGASVTTIDANKVDRVLRVEAKRTATIRDLTIRGGNNVSVDGGGGILNYGMLTLTRVMVTKNNADVGGGIYTYGESNDIRRQQGLSLNESTILDNTANAGGGVALYSYAAMDISSSTIALNKARYSGGGLSVEASNIFGVIIRDSTINNNAAGTGGGGVFHNAGELNLVNSTISNNTAMHSGGGILANNGSTYLYNTSIIDNDAYHDPGDMTGGSGGGIYIALKAIFRITNSLIVRNSINNAPIPDDCKGSLTIYGTEVVGDMTGCNATPGVPSGLISGTFEASKVGSLQDNGGPTKTHALLSGSSAIDNGSGCTDENNSALSKDQRGAPRVFGSRCDVGAVEFNSDVPAQ